MLTARRNTLRPGSGRHTWTVRLLLGLTVLEILLIFVQASFAGQFLGGSGNALERHELLGSALATIAILQLIAAILVWRPGRRSALPILLTFIEFVLVVFQITWGYERELALHVPNALVILTLQFFLLGVVRRAE
jgi:hypothetical protein